MSQPLRVGLTGGIASGKSTVGECFVELGVPVIDADLAARIVVEPGQPGLQQIEQRFGPAVFNAQGTLDRAALRKIVFADANQRRELEAIMHPLIRAEMERQAALARGTYLVFAIPLLVEGGRPRDRVERVLVVDVAETTQLQRLMIRDQCSHEQAAAILASQASRSERLAAADDVLSNEGTLAELRNKVHALHTQYMQLAAARP